MSFRLSRITSPLQSRHRSPLRVLLINDFPILSLGIQQLLQQHEQDLVLVGTIQDVYRLNEVRKIEHDVILIDIDGMHSMDTLRVLKSHCLSRLLAWTRQTSPQIMTAILESGADAVVPKNTDADALLHMLKGTAREKPARNMISLNPNTVRQRLTPKQDTIVTAIGENEAISTEDLAQQLGISVATLRKHIANIYTKLGISNRVALYAYARRFGK